MKIPGKTGDFWPEEIERLQQAYAEFKQRKSEGTGSAWGEHYKLALVLRDIGVEVKGKEGAELEYLTEYVLTYRRIPK
jgi:hypothetical protein